jgi:hypothetical protein
LIVENSRIPTLTYNTPIRTDGFGYADLAAKVAEALAQNHGVFDKVFLFHPSGSTKVMYPARVGVGKKSGECPIACRSPGRLVGLHTRESRQWLDCVPSGAMFQASVTS